ncbi:CarboxypepD_reg-like domain-containing protein [Arenibacter nanhaiticus]|uniref:CarboxypepD_reg-like domain-containing protein n=1 Tax=Arenibacter nanhaiticus TaxID=558155 RepID=A0A1M6H6J3_9FLAO|nr:carboxypeptidase-like regulatory domain-containing protein [Arenibacter nanhaiticus]SHJ17784.1 CarboxypepD_reg-like domain-containing protein [Arenibacter nanhaiticus]
MRQIYFFIITFLMITAGYSQDDGRIYLRGQVLYRDVNVPNENVINVNTEKATITNDNGEFGIYVKEGDEIVFTAINYQLKVVKVTDEILKKNRLVVEVKEKVTELDEVVVTPENQEKFIQVTNKELLLHKYEYETDRSTEVENIALSQSEKGMKDGINFVNIFKALLNATKGDKAQEERAPLKVSEVLRQVYDDEFFVVDLKLPQDKINEFLLYCDAQMPGQSLLKKSNEFQLIDFLVTHSKTFLNELKVQE